MCVCVCVCVCVFFFFFFIGGGVGVVCFRRRGGWGGGIAYRFIFAVLTLNFLLTKYQSSNPSPVVAER